MALAVLLQLENRLPWERLQNALEYLIAHYPNELVRIKGMVYTPGQNEPLLVQGTTGRLYPATRLPVITSDDGIGRLVIITRGTIKGLAEVLEQLPFNADGPLPAIAQQYDTGEVLMLAWMSRTALLETLNTGQVCYWSRSRKQLWRKGETSGYRQQLKELRLDCDGDTLLLLVDQLILAYRRINPPTGKKQERHELHERQFGS